MCGVVGVFANKYAQEIALAGLTRLEYRGYDSAGIASIENGNISCIKTVGKISLLRQKYALNRIQGHVCIGHTRWATHGAPCEKNAHPIVVGRVAVVHNGIIENYESLKSELISKGCVFKSDTDTEIVAHLLNNYISVPQTTPLEAVLKTVKRIHGSFALCVVFSDYNDLMIGIKHKSPLVVGICQDNVTMLCSDVAGLAGTCSKVTYLNDDEIVYIEPAGLKFYDFSEKEIQKEFLPLEINADNFDKCGYSSFMLKEIMEQPKAIQSTLDATNYTVPFDIKKITILACGSSYYAGCIAKYWFEEYLNIQTNVEFASEYVYRDTIINAHEMFIAISQSGETSDTIAAVNKVKGKGIVLSIVNVKNSVLARLSDVVIYTEAGPEIGVASTKSFTSQLAALATLAIRNDNLDSIAGTCENILNNLELQIKTVAQNISQYTNAIFVGRGIMYPVAMEAALKMKELTYMHAEAFAAGELKHGPLALIDDDMPVIVFAPSNNLLKKTVSNIREILARGHNVTVILDDKYDLGIEEAKVVRIPHVDDFLSPFTFTIIAQLLAYHSAELLGKDVDRPRNLAKSVTVE